MYKAIDELGRFVIPKELCKTMNINSNDLLKLELINNYNNSLALIISKVEKIKECLSCKNYCRVNDNFCYNCGLDLSKECDNK